jgi:hypothetical protein
MAIVSSLPAPARICKPASVSSTRTAHLLRPQSKRSVHRMVNCISRKPRKQTAHSQRCCVLNCLRLQYHKRRLNYHHPSTTCPVLLILVPTMALDPTLPQATQLPVQSPLRSRHPPLTRIYSPTCLPATTTRSPATPHHPRRHKAGMVRTWTRELRFTAYLQSV